jgi:rubrerythrin
MLKWRLAATAVGTIAALAAPVAAASASGSHASGDVAASTKTNALTAMHGEAYAYAKYSAFAGQASRTGKTSLARLFTRTADVELSDHFAEEARIASLVDSDQANLNDAITGETTEATTMYPGFAAQATAEGCTAAADLFTEIAADEAVHAASYTSALASLNDASTTVPEPQVADPVTITASAPACSGQTLANLLEAMHGEAFAQAKYNLYADHAIKTGHPEIAKLFRGTATIELREHFAGEAVLAGLVGTNEANLKAAIAGETYEAKTMYPDFSRQAAAAGDRSAARKFWTIGREEGSHSRAFAAAVHRL